MHAHVQNQAHESAVEFNF